MATADVPKENNWAMSDFHSRTLEETPADEKIAMYDEWADDFEKDIRKNEYFGDIYIAKLTLDVIKERFQPSEDPVRILDAGCGTGLVGKALKDVVEGTPYKVHLLGADFSSDMLRNAKEKDVYDELACEDLHQSSLQSDSQDFVISCGLFFDGHCTPTSLPSILRLVRPGGYFISTVRLTNFTSDEPEYRRMVAECGFEFLSSDEMRYLGPLNAKYLVCRRPS